MIENREIADHKGNAAFFERAHQFRAMSMNAIECREFPPVQAGRVQAIDFHCDPPGFFLRGPEFHDAHFFAVGFVRHELFLGHERRMIDERDHLASHAQNPRGGPVVIYERLNKSRGPGSIVARHAGEALEENREAPE